MARTYIRHNKHHSFNLHQICDGCRLCVAGRKSVIYITGLCPRRCFYCPLSDNKRFKDVMYANERLVKGIDEMIEEIRISNSTGAGITGGDPLLVMERTLQFIKRAKKAFGKSFHIHLYTSLVLVDARKLRQLYGAGLDEIRFHPDLDDEKLWGRISLARKYRWKVGVEIPSIPGYHDKTMRMIAKISPHIGFLNINELEISDTNGQMLNEKGFVCKDEHSYAIKGSQEMALKILAELKKRQPKLRVHYCTSRLKDRVQLGNRLMIRAKSIKKPFDVITQDGMILRGFISAEKDDLPKIAKRFSIPRELIEYDPKRKQILIAGWILSDISGDLKNTRYRCGLVTEYPTWDRMIVEVDYLD